ncbi:MAG TPA: hypothetical protein VEI02_03530 [Planctomycetota bacterium]|nr:hypothetical protein [Planctomycetota bacterium]
MRSDVGVITIVAEKRRADALFRFAACELQDRVRDALRAAGIGVVVGGAPYHPDERLAIDRASARRSTHLPLEVGVNVMAFLVVDEVAERDVAALARYLEMVATPGLPIVIAASDALLPRGSTAASDAARRAALAIERVLVVHPITAFGEPPSEALLAVLPEVVAQSGGVRHVVRFANDLRRHVHLEIDPPGGPPPAALEDDERLLARCGAVTERAPWARVVERFHEADADLPAPARWETAVRALADDVGATSVRLPIDASDDLDVRVALERLAAPRDAAGRVRAFLLPIGPRDDVEAALRVLVAARAPAGDGTPWLDPASARPR